MIFNMATAFMTTQIGGGMAWFLCIGNYFIIKYQEEEIKELKNKL